MTARAVLRGFFCALGVLTAAAGCAGGASARELRVADTHPADYPTVQALDHMGRVLAERTHGRMTLKVLHSRLMGEEAETIQHVRAGALDMARVNMAPLNELVPETVVPSLPFVFRSADHLHRVLDGPIGTDIARAFEPHGFVALAFYDSGARSFYNARHPLRRPADLKGMRVRVQQSPLAEAMIRALGAVPAALPYGQVGVALRTGVIDGAENNWPSFESARHFETAQFYSLTEHSMAPEVLLVSRRVWDELPAADQRALRDAARESVGIMRILWHEREQRARDALATAGVLVNEVDKAPFAAAMRPVWNHFTAEPRLRELLQRIQAAE